MAVQFLLRPNLTSGRYELIQPDQSVSLEFGSIYEAFRHAQTLATDRTAEVLIYADEGKAMRSWPLFGSEQQPG